MSPLRLAALAAALLAAPAASAQLLNVGVSGGANFATLADARTADLENTTGYHVGVYADVPAVVAAVRVGVYYLRAGDVEGPSGQRVTADFVTVPVDLHIQTPTPVVKGYVLAGPEVRFAIDSSDNVPTVDRESVNVAGNVGVGAKFGSPLGGLSGFLEVRYARDLTAFAQDQGLLTDNDYKLSMFMVRAGLGL